MTGSQIRKARRAVGMTQAELAFHSGVPLTYVSLIEEEKRLERYITAMQTTIDAKKAQQAAPPAQAIAA